MGRWMSWGCRRGRGIRGKRRPWRDAQARRLCYRGSAALLAGGAGGAGAAVDAAGVELGHILAERFEEAVHVALVAQPRLVAPVDEQAADGSDDDRGDDVGRVLERDRGDGERDAGQADGDGEDE